MITLSNTTIEANAAQGTVIGSFTITGGPANAAATLDSDTAPAAYFLVSGNKLLTAWAGEALPGEYQLRVHAQGGPPQQFTVVITPPISITLSLDNGVTVEDDSQLQVQVSQTAAMGTLLMAPPVRLDNSGNVIAGTTFAFGLGNSGYFLVGPDDSLHTTWTAAAPPQTGSYPITITATSPDGTSEQITYTIVID